MSDEATRLIPVPAPPNNHQRSSKDHQDGTGGCMIQTIPRLMMKNALRPLMTIRGMVFAGSGCNSSGQCTTIYAERYASIAGHLGVYAVTG